MRSMRRPRARFSASRASRRTAGTGMMIMSTTETAATATAMSAGFEKITGLAILCVSAIRYPRPRLRARRRGLAAQAALIVARRAVHVREHGGYRLVVLLRDRVPDL